MLKLKEPGLHARLFQFPRRRRREFNFSTSPKNMLDSCPTPIKRLINVFYEPFLRGIKLEGFSQIQGENSTVRALNL